MVKRNCLYYIFSLFILSCSSPEIDYKALSSFDENNKLRAVIEIPAGTNNKIEYQPSKNTFEMDTVKGKLRLVKFLPYPFNYGFIPSTKVNYGRSGDALDIMVFGKSVKTAQVISVNPIALLKLNNEGEAAYKILSVPVDPKNQIISIKDFKDLSINYPKVRDLIAEWILNYDKTTDLQILGWFDEIKALERIKAVQTEKTEHDGE